MGLKETDETNSLWTYCPLDAPEPEVQVLPAEPEPEIQVLPPVPELTTDCGNHKAVSCKECPEGNGAAWCNGECEWVNGGLFALLGAGECKPKQELTTDCGNHKAVSCIECPE